MKDCIGTCYDTTASNSGHKNGAHFRIEKQVGHAILELECRTHVYEVHVTQANKAIFGPTKGPQKSYYKDFKTAWSSLKLDTSSMKLFYWQKYSGQEFLIQRAKSSLHWAQDNLDRNTFPREDSKELNEGRFQGNLYLSGRGQCMMPGSWLTQSTCLVWSSSPSST